MCGIAGVLSTIEPAPGLVEGMARTLDHRGPDDNGVWYDRAAGIGLGHRRLSIIDLSADGHQPMHSACGRYVIVYNGEVYNFAQLRAELEAAGTGLRSRTDTEVILEGIAHWGLERTVARLVGMFAFALWDREREELTLVRDRLGIKPLYYGRCRGNWLFGSELKALCAGAGESFDVDRNALALMLRYGYVPGEHTIYRGVRKLPAGCWVRLTARQAEEPPVTRYWSVQDVAEVGRGDAFRGSPEQAVDALQELLREAVKLRMVADVPIGAFLSGGIDSSTVVALMQEQSSRPVKTFSIGFREAGFDEAQHARAVAEHLGTEHQELYVTPEQAMAVIPRLPEIYDEPFADASAIPTLLVSELARRDVTVSLSGDGGDELFYGYRRYFDLQRLWNKVGRLPYLLRAPAARLMPRGGDGGGGRRVASMRELLGAREAIDVYHWRISEWRQPERVLIGGASARLRPRRVGAGRSLEDYAAAMMLHDQRYYLADDILTKVDRASMAVALEARVPLLDHRVVEFAWRLPVAWKLRDGQGKWPLRQVLYRYVPAKLFDRPKQGFSVPLRHWLRGPLREWAEALLDPCRLKAEGFFDPVPLQALWQEHLNGRHDHAQRIWSVLMFQAWLEQQSRERAWEQPASALVG